MRYLCLLLAVVATSPGIALGSERPLLDAFQEGLERIDPVLQSQWRSHQASGQSETYDEYLLQLGGLVVQSKQLRLSGSDEELQATLSDVIVKGGVGDGLIKASEIRLGLQGFQGLLQASAGWPMVSTCRSADSSTNDVERLIDARSVVLQADPDALPNGHGPESILVERLFLDQIVVSDEGQDCFGYRLEVSGIATQAIDGSTLRVGRLSVAAGGSEAEQQLSARIENLRAIAEATHPEDTGGTIVSLQAFSLEGAFDQAFLADVQQVPAAHLKHLPTAAAAITDVLGGPSPARFSVSVSLDGLDLPLANFLPSDIVGDTSGLKGIRGSMAGGLAVNDGAIVHHHDISLDGLFDARGHLGITVDPVQPSGPRSAKTRQSGLMIDALSAIHLSSADFSFADSGLDHLVEQIVGLGLVELFDATEARAASGAPPEFADAADRVARLVSDWLASGITGTANASFRPEEPANLAVVMAAAALSAEAAAYLLGLGNDRSATEP